MKKSFIALMFLNVLTISYGQKQFSSKPEALKYINDVFSNNFVKTYVDFMGMPNYSMFSYDYQITDKYLLIIHKSKGIRKGLDFTLLPFDKIDAIRSDNDYPHFKTTSSLIISSHCRCLKSTKDVKEFKGEDIFDELITTVFFPFNVNDEKYLLESMQNAYNVISGNAKTNLESTRVNPIADERFNPVKLDYEAVLKLKREYAGIALLKQKNDLEKNSLHGKVKKIEETNYNVEESISGQPVLKKNYATKDSYNTNGYLTENEFDFGQGLVTTKSYVYNDRSLIVLIYNLEDSTINTNYAYAKLLNGGYQITQTSSNSSSKTTMIYNDENLLETKLEFESTPEISRYTYKNEYDNAGNCISSAVYLNDTLYSTYKFSIYKKNLSNGVKEFDAKGNLVWFSEIKFDNSDNPAEVVMTDKNKVVEKTIFEKPDANGNSTGNKIYVDGKLKKVIEIKIEYY